MIKYKERMNIVSFYKIVYISLVLAIILWEMTYLKKWLSKNLSSLLLIIICCRVADSLARTGHLSTTNHDAHKNSLATPWKTIVFSLTQLHADDTLHIHESISFKRAFASGINGITMNPIGMRSFPGKTATIDNGLHHFSAAPDSAGEPVNPSVNLYNSVRNFGSNFISAGISLNSASQRIPVLNPTFDLPAINDIQREPVALWSRFQPGDAFEQTPRAAGSGLSMPGTDGVDDRRSEAAAISETTVGTGDLQILLPLYSYPNWYTPGAYIWDDVAAAAQKVPVTAIINPNNGPDGGPPNSDYVVALAQLRDAGVTILGYVYTSYGARSLAAVKSDIDLYDEFYNIHGIFFDETASTAAQLSYYAELYNYVKAKENLEIVVTNPGTQCDESYISLPATNTALIFENDTGWPAYTVDAYVSRYETTRFASLMYKVVGADAMRGFIDLAVSRQIGYVYVTSDSGANPWDSLPDYWQEEVNYVKAYRNACPRLQVRAFLQGPFSGSGMTTALAAYLPVQSPYAEDSRTVADVPDNVSDWILLQLRHVDGSTVAANFALFLTADGSIIDESGNGNINLTQTAAGDYYIVLKHRNHLAVMSRTPIHLSAGATGVYDFSTGLDKYYGNDAARLTTDSLYGLRCGDINQDGLVTTLDYTLWYNAARSTVDHYQKSDVDCNGLVNAADWTLWYGSALLGTACTFSFP